MARWVLHIPGCRSLKMKRSVVRSLTDRLRSRFSVSVAETDFQDLWQKTEICAAVVSGDRGRVESLLSKLDDAVEADPRAHVVESETAFF